MTDRSEVIGVRVTPEEKQKFKQHIEENNEFTSLSRMFRTLASKHVRNYGEEDTASIDPEEIINAVEAGLSGVTEQMDQLETRMAELESQVSHSDEIDKLARELYSCLPEYEDEKHMLDPQNMDDTEDKLLQAKQLSTEFAWQDYFGVEKEELSRAIARMQEYFPDVAIKQDNELDYRRYYKKVPASEGEF